MIYKNINKLKTTPTSRLVFSEVYSGYTSHTLEQNRKAIDYRLLKRYNLDKNKSLEIIKQDKNIIEKRGDRLDDYAFAKGFSLPNTLNVLYSQLTMSDVVEEMFQNLTFSELALARDLFFELEKIYNKRVEDAKMTFFGNKGKTDARLANYFGFLDYFSHIALGLRLGKNNFQDSSLYSLDSISGIGHYERKLVTPFDSRLQRDLYYKREGSFDTSDVDIHTIAQHQVSQYIYHRYTK